VPAVRSSTASPYVLRSDGNVTNFFCRLKLGMRKSGDHPICFRPLVVALSQVTTHKTWLGYQVKYRGTLAGKWVYIVQKISTH
jgi:hypothetical protein